MSQAIKPPPLPPLASDVCPVHPHNRSIGQCPRCHQSFCDVCATRWQNEELCLACFTQILQSNEPTPGDRERQKKGGIASLVLAIIGWLMFLGSFWLFLRICDGKGNKELAIIDSVLFLTSFIAPLLSLGLATATLRGRGPSMKSATYGLVLAALQIGLTVSVVVLNATHN